MKSTISIQNLTKYYGRIHAVENLSLDIPDKSVFGLLGPNGSGKTTTLGMILDVVIPSSGNYLWFGSPNKKANRQRIGSILETPCFYPYLSAANNLKIIADIKQCSYNNIDKTLALVGLYERKSDKFKTFSLGMKQRLAIASALLCDPDVLVLDEPTNGLDPQGIAEIRNIIKQIAQHGKTVLLASHLLDEVQKVCTHFGVLHHGKLIYNGKVNEVSGEEYWVEVASDNLLELEDKLKKYPHQHSVRSENEKLAVLLTEKSNIKDLSAYLYEHKIIPTHLFARRKNLEQQFLDILNQSENEYASQN
ncbi:MAG: ATP-binding cassette domain-containing protein [Bacteroidales bacterium]|nr:ATP-binding cassette domain-containing protein [Bacteroidales bacterium]